MNRYLYAGVLEELEEARREKYEMDALVAQYGGMSAVEPSLRDQATGYLADGLQAVGLYDNNPRAAARTAGALTGVMDFLPGTGEALAAADAQHEFEQGNVGMGVLYAAGALPIVPAAATKAAGNAVKGLKAWHSGPNKIDGPFDLSDKDVGIHLADNEALATNAAVKSGFERGIGRDQMQTSPYLIDAGEDQIYDIAASSNRFDAIDVVDELVAAGKIDAERGALMVDDILKLEDSPLEVNQYLRDNLEDASGIRALRYQNTFDAGPTWEDLELGVLKSDVEPAPSYMIFNPDYIQAAPAEATVTAPVKKANAARQGSGRSKNRVGTTGQYVGAPDGVDSPQALAKIRRDYESAAVTGAPGRDWYSDSSEWIEQVAAPGREQPVADALGITSAGTGVDTNLGFTVKGVNQMATGLPVDTGRFPNSMGPLLTETAAGNRAHLGPKRQPFADNLSVSWNPEMAHTPVHDIWDGRAWGYVGPNGKPWDAGFSAAQHSFMDDQAQFVIDRMNKNNAGGFNDWNGLNSQAAAWTGAKIKAGDLSPEDAAKHYGDFSTKYQASGTHEQIPGVGTGHLEGMADLPYADREAYTQAASWRNEKGQDRLYSDAGMLVEPTLDGVGAYTPSSGVLEINPLEVARPLVTTADGAVRANEKQLLDIAESSRAYVDAQNAGAWNKVIPESQAKAGDRSSLLIPIEGGPSADQMGALSELAGNNGMFVIDNGDGVLRMANDEYTPIGEARTGTTLGKELKKGELKDGLDELGLEAERAKIELGYQDYEEAWQAGEGSEVATKQFLERLDENPEYAAKIEGALMDKAAANLERDAAIAVEKGLATRQDIQTARKLLSEGGLQALRDAIGKGILPAALLGIVLNLPEQNDSAPGVLSA